MWYRASNSSIYYTVGSWGYSRSGSIMSLRTAETQEITVELGSRPQGEYKKYRVSSVLLGEGE